MRLRYNDEQHAYWIDGRRAKGVTSAAKIPDDTYYLDKWQRRMVAIGLASEPPLMPPAGASPTAAPCAPCPSAGASHAPTPPAR